MGVIDGRVAIITGAGRGIGASISRLFAREGAALVVNDLGGGAGRHRRRPGPGQADRRRDHGRRRPGRRRRRRHRRRRDRRAAGAHRRRAVRPARHRRQRGRHPARPDDLQHGRAGLGRGDPGSPEGPLLHGPRRPPRTGASSVTPGPLPGHQLHLRLGAGRVAGPAELRGGQDGHHRAYLLARAGARPLRRHRQRDRARRGHQAHRDRPAGQAHTGAERAAEGDRRRSPDNIAPVALYLASEQSGWLTGRVVSSAGYEVGLYENPQIIRQLSSAGRGSTRSWPR